jgi:hypothetical protein
MRPVGPRIALVRPSTDATDVDRRAYSEDDAVTVATAEPTGSGPAIATTEVVPTFRADLKLTRGASGYQIVEPSTGRAFTVNEFEISIIRMLDGKRRISDLLDHCRRLEIPINAESLSTFILNLERAGLLGAAASAEATTWSTRAQWESSIRSLFQSGIRFLRMGKHEEAASYFEALLQEDPNNIEARELLAMTRQPNPVALAPQVAAPYAPPPQVAAPYAPAPQVAVPYAQPPHVVAPPQPPQVAVPYAPPPQVAAPFSPPPQVAAPFAPPLPVTPHPMSTPDPYAMSTPDTYAMTALSPSPRYPRMPATQRLGFAAKIGIALVACVVLGAVFAIVARQPSSNETRSTDSVASMETQDEATATDTTSEKRGTNAPAADTAIKPAQAKPDKTEPVQEPAGQQPEPQQPEPQQPEPQQPEPEPQQPEQVKPDATEPPKAEPRRKTPTKKVVGEPTRIEAPHAGVVTVYLRGARNVRKGDKLFVITRKADAADLEELTAKVAELSELAKEDPVYEPFLVAARDKLRSANQGQRTRVLAPRAGKASPRVKQGARVQSGTLLVEIE